MHVVWSILYVFYTIQHYLNLYMTLYYYTVVGSCLATTVFNRVIEGIMGHQIKYRIAGNFRMVQIFA